MSKLWIREYARSGSAGLPSQSARASIPVAMEPGTDQAPVTFTTSTQSAAFGSTTSFVEVVSDADCHYVVGTNPTATTNAIKLMAGVSKFFGVEPGQKLAVVTAS